MEDKNLTLRAAGRKKDGGEKQSNFFVVRERRRDVSEKDKLGEGYSDKKRGNCFLFFVFLIWKG